MKHFLALVFVLTVSISLDAQIVKNFRAHTEYLASDQLEGRGPGSKGIKLAADYIAAQFESIGLKRPVEATYFQPFGVPGAASGINERNVVGVISAVKITDRSIIFTAHYDAYGIKEVKGKDDKIHNGAQDNAIGVAALIELARLFSNQKAPKQNLVFIATAAEEIGSVGSAYYLQNPVFPVEKITICLNFDGFNVSGPRMDYFVMPRQGVDFVDEIEAVGKRIGWEYAPKDWVDGMNKNFDTAAFLRLGVPAFTLWTGDKQKASKHSKPKFGSIHTPEDEVNKSWNWDGVEDHLFLYKAIAEDFLSNERRIKVTDPSLFKD